MATNVRQDITLKGSCKILCEYLEYAMNNVLFQRAICPSDDFEKTENYGIPLFMLKEGHKDSKWIKNSLHYIKIWMEEGRLTSLKLSILDIENRNVTLEQWKFAFNKEENNSATSSKDIKIIRMDIRDVMRQITSTISFLPRLNMKCCLALTYEGITAADFPSHWKIVRVNPVKHSGTVELKTFTTGIHKMSTDVTYDLDLDP